MSPGENHVEHMLCHRVAGILRCMSLFILVSAVVLLPPELEVELQHIIDGRRSCRSLRIHYSDGDQRLGQTVVRLQGGYARVLRTWPGKNKPDEYSGAIGRKGCRRLARQILKYPFSKRRFGRRSLKAGETQPRLTIRIGQLPAMKMRRRGFDVQNDPGFAVLRGEVLRIASQLSGGAVLW